jgi:hypothetical protein
MFVCSQCLFDFICIGNIDNVTRTRQADAKPKEWKQFLLLGCALVWLVLVPLAHSHGFVDG